MLHRPESVVQVEVMMASASVERISLWLLWQVVGPEKRQSFAGPWSKMPGINNSDVMYMR